MLIGIEGLWGQRIQILSFQTVSFTFTSTWVLTITKPTETHTLAKKQERGDDYMKLSFLDTGFSYADSSQAKKTFSDDVVM